MNIYDQDKALITFLEKNYLVDGSIYVNKINNDNEWGSFIIRLLNNIFEIPYDICESVFKGKRMRPIT